MKSKKPLEIKLERTIAATPREVCAAWMNPKVPGTPWNMGEKLILQPKVDGLFYWLVHGTPHYGRFVKVARPGLIQHTWMSPYTEGKESMVTVTFKKTGEDTLMTLVHSGLPNNETGRRISAAGTIIWMPSRSISRSRYGRRSKRPTPRLSLPPVQRYLN